MLTSMDFTSQLGLILVRLEEPKVGIRGYEKDRKWCLKNATHHLEIVEVFKRLITARSRA